MSESWKCFLVEATGETYKAPCLCSPGCTEVIERRVFRRTDTGEVANIYPWNFPVGAMWFVEHDPGECFAGWSNCDGKHLHVKTPGNHWDIDSRASNCGLKSDNVHRCWIRHGVPPNLTVDKDGKTCSAGAGSIQAGKWHGFITKGVLSDRRQ